MATAAPTGHENPGSWVRTYPPVAAVLVAFLLAAFVLPSSLNLPQSNPSTVLEYAPVPPEDDDPPSPPDGNLSALGLGSSGTLTAGAARPPALPPLDNPDDERGRGDRPRQKRCVGHRDPDGTFMVRQTEDPMSPECVPFFDGDNFGATYQGVTADEIKIVLYVDNGAYGGGEDSPSARVFWDLDAPPKPRCPETYPSPNPNADRCDNVLIRTGRALSRHFNYRYQTYGRHVHFYLYVSDSQTESARRGDATKIWTEMKPFAVIDHAKFHGYNEAFEDSLAARGILTFTSKAALQGQFFRKNEPYGWGFWPDVEHWSELYASYVCQKLGPVDGHPRTVRWSGNPQGNPQNGFNGRPRKFALWHTSAPGEPGLRLFAELVRSRLEGCGIDIASDRTYRFNRFATDNQDPGTDQAAAVAEFKTNEITTVLWLGGIESKFTKEAEAASYYPELVIAGDLHMDGNEYGELQAKGVWQNAFGTSFQLRQDHEDERPSSQAAREGDPQIDDAAARFSFDLFRDFFMTFQTIQVAGPRLTPDQVDRGMHAIRKTRSNSPYRAAFYFDPGDFSSVKDSMLIWWSHDSIPPGESKPGCFKMVQGADTTQPGAGYGARALAWEWNRFFAQEPFEDQAAPCTTFPGRAGIRPA